MESLLLIMVLLLMVLCDLQSTLESGKEHLVVNVVLEGIVVLV